MKGACNLKNFALIGAAGYVAPRHMRAIRDNGNRLIAALDVHDSVGVLDSFFPKARFFKEFERFDRHVDKLNRVGGSKKVDFVSVCSPNYLHDSHVRFGLRSNCDVICEKPIVLNPWNLDGLEALETDTGKRVFTILQLRLHPSIISLKSTIDSQKMKTKVDVDLTYITSRGNWYFQSWKGDKNKSGGIATNIGIHFFDVLIFLFGQVKQSTLHFQDDKKASGFLEFSNARVRWFLSLDSSDLALCKGERDIRTFRSINYNGNEIEFSTGFEDLHTISYSRILEGNGFSLGETRHAIETVADIRSSTPIGLIGNYHPFLKGI